MACVGPSPVTSIVRPTVSVRKMTALKTNANNTTASGGPKLRDRRGSSLFKLKIGRNTSALSGQPEGLPPRGYRQERHQPDDTASVSGTERAPPMNPLK